MKRSEKQNSPAYIVDDYELALTFIQSIDAQLKLLQDSVAKAGKEYEELLRGRIDEKLDERTKWMKIRDAN
jgi:hypothetical protein